MITPDIDYEFLCLKTLVFLQSEKNKDIFESLTLIAMNK